MPTKDRRFKNQKALEMLQAAHQTKNLEEHTRDCGVPRRYHGANLDQFEGIPDELRQKMPLPFVLITGPPESGKSHLAAALAIQWYCSWKSGYSIIRDFEYVLVGRSEHRTTNACVNALVEIDFLVLDAVDPLIVAQGNLFDEILERRYQDMAPTIVTARSALYQPDFRCVGFAKYGHGMVLTLDGPQSECDPIEIRRARKKSRS